MSPLIPATSAATRRECEEREVWKEESGKRDEESAGRNEESEAIVSCTSSIVAERPDTATNNNSIIKMVCFTLIFHLSTFTGQDSLHSLDILVQELN